MQKKSAVAHGARYSSSAAAPRCAERVLRNPGSTHLRNSRREQPEFITVPVRLGACVAPEGRVCPAPFSTHLVAARPTRLPTHKVHLHTPALAHPLVQPRSFRHPSRSGATRLGDGRVAVARRGTHTGSFPLNEFKSGSPAVGDGGVAQPCDGEEAKACQLAPELGQAHRVL
jgi:hypothetical protein